MDLALVGDFAIALLIGALVGIEREKKKASAGPGGIGGIRTFVLFAEAGAVSAWLSKESGSPWIFVAAVAAIAGIVVAGYLAHTREHPDSLGLTTEAAAIAVCLLGGATMFGYRQIAVCLAIATAAVLALKEPIHGIVEKIGTDDIYAGLELLFATFIVLPLLPNRTIDPWDAINPYKAWWLVILIASLSLVGYVAVRWLGPGRGTAVTGLAGGLVSSTAVTLSFARQSREASAAHAGDLLVGGALLAWTVMFVRVVIMVAVVHRPLLAPLLMPFGAMTAAAGVAAVILLRRGSSAEAPKSEVPLKNPFSLGSAIRFALLFSAILLVVKLVQTHAPEQGLYAVAALAGTTDVDAITLSMAKLAKEGGESSIAVGSIVIAAIANTLVKCGMIVSLGRASLRVPILVSSGAILAAGIAALWIG